MGRRWLKHGKWARWMVWLHYYSIVSFVLLMVSGVALFWPPIHTALIPYLPVIYDIHIALGLTFTVSLLTPFLTRWPAAKLIRRFDWFFPMLFGSVIVATGILIWQGNWFPTTWSSIAFHWHGYVSYTLTAWLIIHAAYKIMGYRPSQSGFNPRVDPERRMFLQWIGAGAVSTVFITAIEPAVRIGKLVGLSSTSGGAFASSAFPAFYTVTGQYPTVDESTYGLNIGGLVKHQVTLSWSQLMSLVRKRETVDFHCVTGWSVANVTWEGIHIESIVNLVQPTSAVKFVHFYSLDGVYTESLSLADALDPTVILAYRMDGQPLKVKQGYPLRLVVPKKYGYKSIKWVGRVEFSDKPLNGYWEARGYSNQAAVNHSI